MRRIREKTRKLIQYIKLEWMFRKKSEFRKIHPELVDLWKRKFRQMIRHSSDRTFPIAEEFLNVKIEKIKDSENTINHEAPILLCALKNDFQKMKVFIEHYRKQGICNFVLLDNGSTDGTFEFLSEQPDVELYRCEHGFSADGKIAWLNRLIAEYGDNHWYIMVDSDEFFGFLGDDKYSFTDLANAAMKKGIKRVGMVYLDMYPKGDLFDGDKKDNFMEEYCYFDIDTFEYTPNPSIGLKITGGPRKRVFGTKMKISAIRMVYFEALDVVPSAHYIMPLSKAHVPVYIASRHFKFMNESDYAKVIEAVETGIHSDNSAEYKTYYQGIQKMGKVSFYDEEHSVVYSEENLKKIPFMESPFTAC